MKSTLRKLLPHSVIQKLIKTKSSFDNFIYPFFAKSRFGSAFYFCFFSTQFYREHQAVLQGRVNYKASLKKIESSSILLRRNIHRLEKGLIMKPRKKIFAESYIQESVECYKKCSEVPFFCQKELKWAADVLIKYFHIVDSSKVTDRARLLFQRVTIAKSKDTELSLPYLHSERVVSGISDIQLHQLFKQRRSVRWYKDKKVDIKLIHRAVEMAAQAPSACNRQPFQFYTFTDPKKASEIAAIPMGTKGFSENIQALIVIVGDLSAYPKERDRHLIYLDGGLVAMQLMLAFESLGLSTCPINWPDIETYEKRMDKALNLELNKRPIMLMAVGYGDESGGIPFSQKKSAQQLIKEID